MPWAGASEADPWGLGPLVPRQVLCHVSSPPAHRHRDRAAHPFCYYSPFRVFSHAVDHISGTSRTRGQSSGHDAPGFTTWSEEQGRM